MTPSPIAYWLPKNPPGSKTTSPTNKVSSSLEVRSKERPLFTQMQSFCKLGKKAAGRETCRAASGKAAPASCPELLGILGLGPHTDGGLIRDGRKRRTGSLVTSTVRLQVRPACFHSFSPQILAGTYHGPGTGGAGARLGERKEDLASSCGELTCWGQRASDSLPS